MAEEVDEWLKEFEEALRLTEETTGDIQEQHSGNSNNIDGMLTNSDKPMQPVSVSSARRKLTQLSKRIERLESLLQDPDIKATISQNEMYSRQDMLVGIQFKARQMAGALASFKSPSRDDLFSREQSRPSLNVGVPKQFLTESLSDKGLVGLQKQVVIAKGADLAELKGNVLGLKDVAITVRHDSDLHAPLLVNMDQAEEDSEIPQRQVAKKQMIMLTTKGNGGCSVIWICLLSVATATVLLVVMGLAKL